MADLESKEDTVTSNVAKKEGGPLPTTQESTASGPAVSTPVTSFDVEDQTAVSPGVERGYWGSNAEFIMAALAITIDYSLIWRLPYMCYRNGGVVYMILYGIFLLLFGVPIFYMDLSLGQFCGKGPAHIYNLSPLLRGIGVGMVVVIAMCHPLYSTITSWSLYYLFQSGSTVLPWSTCSNMWNTISCIDDHTASFNTSQDSYMFRMLSSPGEEYFNRRVLDISTGLEQSGGLRWQLVGCTFATALLIFAALFWGVKVTGKVMLVTVPLIFLLLLALFIRGMTLPGSLEGVKYALLPSASSLLELQTWTSALISAWYTIGMATGVISTLASYKRFKSTALRDSYIVCGVSLGVGMITSMMVFAFFGAIAQHKGVAMHNVVTAGPSTVYIAMAEMLARLPVPQVWSFALFFMLLLMGLSTQVLTAEVVITAVLDSVPRRSRLIRIVITAAVCGVSFLLTFPYLSEGGIYFFTMVDISVMRLSLYVFGFLQLLTVGWIYGIEQLSRDIKMMTGLRPPVVFKPIWCFVLPPLSC
ncbi:sodium- and chloride-dependent glycine transporter 1-like [Haliotis rubra]|uniref:sodium- and chloride-dependent glycine transporter 1-like n=1 Tax=Haliotis rubra TaxID=36100 RepID=UPI001EE5D77C|nr:sodium- and chloride-dependent glycine transporter 1-like [Haliotis rubra]XP_046544083.1 sodium- and chloride-dependent glycine transporter 1-like [Haliotis rubra]